MGQGNVEELIDVGVEITVKGKADGTVDTEVGADRVEGEAKALVDTEIGTTVDGDQEVAVDTGVDTTVEGEADAAVDTEVGTKVEGDAEERINHVDRLRDLSDKKMYKKNLRFSYVGVREKP
ncbi:hypothetical protein Fot_45355 [Forsythia ovata]|uniref:Uncharacterized protein n=1 Tax=Forsythia ovata TaxID=205694 RepID=A0ABD1R800_9LAMI